MNAQTVKQYKTASRYAEALAKFDERDAICDELIKIQDIFEKSQDLINFLESPIVSIDDKKEICSKVFESFSKTTKTFLQVLIDKNRISYFNSILDALKEKIDDVNNVTRVKVLSAVELTEEEKQRLSDKIKSKLDSEIKTDYQIDETVIAGLIIQIGDKVIDNSLKTRYEGLKKQLI